MSILDEGRTIGGLRIGRMLGHGAMGEVYRAEQTVLHRAVAVKRILPQFAGSTSALERLAREARALASVRSPYVVQVHDLVRAEGEVLLVMELVEGGGPLRAWCGRLPWAQATCLVRHLAEALAGAHAAGVIHRDVKPDNALLAADGTARLGDFGLARALDSSQLTSQGAVVGTPAYLAPECQDGRNGGEPADIYSLGCTWYHLIAGHPPYRGSDVSDLLRRHAHEPPPDLRAMSPDVDADIATLLSTCLAKDPARRPTASALAQRLRGHPAVPERLSEVRPPPLADPQAATLTPEVAAPPTASTAPTATGPLPTPATLRAPVARRRRWPYAVAVLLLAVGGTLLALRPDPHAAQAAVRRLAEIGQITEARAGITRIVQADPAQPVEALVRDVDLAEARHLWRIGRQKEAVQCYDELLGRHRGDQIAAHAVLADLPAFEPVTRRALLALDALATDQEAAAAWRWLPPANRVAKYYPQLVALLAARPASAGEARARLTDKDESERNAAFDVLEKAGATSDADRIAFHATDLIRLGSAERQAVAALAWLTAEAAKPDWATRLAAATLPDFAEAPALRETDAHADAVEALLVRAFPAQIGPQVATWEGHGNDTLAARAKRMRQALSAP